MLGVGFVAEVFFAVRTASGCRATAGRFDAINEGGNAQAIARVLFSKYFFPFEVTSILLIIAAIAAMVLAPRKARRRSTQAAMDARAADRVHTGSEPSREDADRLLPRPFSVLFAIGSVGVLVRRTRSSSSCRSSCS